MSIINHCFGYFFQERFKLCCLLPVRICIICDILNVLFTLHWPRPNLILTWIIFPMTYTIVVYLHAFLLPCLHRYVISELQYPFGGCNCLYRHPNYSPRCHGCLLCFAHQTEKTHDPVTSPDWEWSPFNLPNCQFNTSWSTKHGSYAADKVKQVTRNSQQ